MRFVSRIQAPRGHQEIIQCVSRRAAVRHFIPVPRRRPDDQCPFALRVMKIHKPITACDGVRLLATRHDIILGHRVVALDTPRLAHTDVRRGFRQDRDITFTFVAGGWDNNRLNEAKLPDNFLIDYVRVWQRRELASDTAPPK